MKRIFVMMKRFFVLTLLVGVETVAPNVCHTVSSVVIRSAAILSADEAAERPGSTSRGIDYYEKQLLKNPRYGAIFDRVYYDFADRGDIAGLLRKIDELSMTDSPEEEVNSLLLRGLILVRHNDLDGGIRAFRDAEKKAPTHPQVASALGKTLILRGAMGEGAEALTRALSGSLSEKERLDVLQRLGETYLRLDEAEKARDVWEIVRKENSDRPDVLSRIAGIYENAGRYREALAFYQNLEAEAERQRLTEKEIQYAFAAAEIKIRLGEKEDALHDLERLNEEISPDHWLFAPLRDRIEAIFLRRSDYNALLDYYRSWNAKHVNDLDAVRRQASVLTRLFRFDEAKEVLTDALAKAPSDTGVRRSQVELALTQNQYDEVDRLCSEMESPNDPDLLLAWGGAVLQSETLDETTKKDRAVKIWKKILADRYDDRATVLLVAGTLAKNRCFTDAEALYQKLVENDPKNFANIEQLAEFYLDQGEREKSLVTLARLTEKEDASAETFEQAAEFLYRHGFFAESCQARERAIKRAPERFDLRRRDIESRLDGGENAGLREKIADAESLATTDDEKNALLSLQLRSLKETDEWKPFLDSLDVELRKTAPNDTERLAEFYWKKCVALLSVDDPATAVETMIEAFEKNGVSTRLLQKGSEIAAKSPLPDRTLELLSRLCEQDPANRAGYLRSLAKVRLELGELDAALETGKKLFESGANRSSDALFYANLLADSGQLDEATAVLRASLRLDSADPAILARLSELLDEAQKTDEAIDLQWRRFSLADRLEDKLRIVDSLVRYYVKLDRFEIFRERLESSARTESDRRENAYCLARGLMTMKDYAQARSTLESLLTAARHPNEEDEFLLGHLSQLAELQNDLDAAIRYQEALCASGENEVENQRLLALYRQAGQGERARLFLLRTIVPNEPLWKQLDTADALAAVGDYDTASKLLRRLSEKFPNNWEITAREMMIAGWTGADDLSVLIETIESSPLSSATPSVKTLEIKRDPSLAASGVSGGAWQLGNQRDVYVRSLETPQELADFASQLLLTIYREHLTPIPFHGPKGASEQAPKPMLTFPTLESAKIAARAWKERETFVSLDAEARKIGEPIETLTGESKPDDFSLKELYVLERFALLAEENGRVSPGFPPPSGQEVPDSRSLPGIKQEETRFPRYPFDRVGEMTPSRPEVRDRIAAIFALQGRREWTSVGFPVLLAKFNAEQNAERKKSFVAPLVEMMEASLADPGQNASLYSLAPAFISTLRSGGFTDEERRVQAVFDRAVGRDYSLLLTEIADGEILSFDRFDAILSRAETEAVRQARHRNEIERSYQKFGEIYARRLDQEFRAAFEGTNPAIVERLKNSADVWMVLSEKVTFGERVLRSFIRVKKRALGLAGESFLTDVAEEERGAFADSMRRYCLAVEAILLRAFKTDRTFNAAFGDKLAPKAAVGEITLAQLTRYLNRDLEKSRNLIPFLINKAFYAPMERPSVVESGKLLEMAFGMSFALDLAFPAGDAADSLTRFLAAEPAEDNDSIVYRRKMGEILAVLKRVESTGVIDLSDTVESLAELKIKANDGLLYRCHGPFSLPPSVTFGNLGAFWAGQQKKTNGTGIFTKENSSRSIPLYGALAMIALLDGDESEALDFLEKIPLLRFSDVKTREFLLLGLFASSTDAKISQRKAEAIGYLLGCRLTEEETMTLYSILIRENRPDEASKIFKRLLRTASREKNIAELLETIQTRRQENSPPGEDEIVFALRAFRMPLWDKSASSEWNDIRVRSLDLLAVAGKLGEIRSQLEQRLAFSPGSLDFLLQLADVEIRLGEKQRAEELFPRIETRLTDDAALGKNYARLLARADKTDLAVAFLIRAFTKDPAAFFAEREQFEFWNERRSLEFLRSMEPERLVPMASPTFGVLADVMKKESYRDDAFALIESFWKGENLSPESKSAVQNAGIRTLVLADDERFYPFLRGWIFDQFQDEGEYVDATGIFRSIPRSPSETGNLSGRGNGKTQREMVYQDIHQLVQWRNESPATLSGLFLDGAKKKGALEDLLDEVRQINEKLVGDPSVNAEQFSGAAVFEIQLLAKLGRFDEAAERVRDRERDERFCPKGAKNDALALVVAFGVDSGQPSEFLRPYYEKMVEENPYPVCETFYKKSMDEIEKKEKEQKQ